MAGEEGLTLEHTPREPQAADRYHAWYSPSVDPWPPDLAEELVWDPGNEQHATRHGVSREEIDGMYDLGEWIVEPDPQGRPGQGRLVGPTLAGRLITVAVEWLPERNAYRPISAWDAERSERRQWRRDVHGRG